MMPGEARARSGPALGVACKVCICDGAADVRKQGCQLAPQRHSRSKALDLDGHLVSVDADRRHEFPSFLKLKVAVGMVPDRSLVQLLIPFVISMPL